MAKPDPQELYDEFYYATGCGLPYRRDEHWTTFFGRIADGIVTTIDPQSVLDAGCALGLLVEQLRLREVEAEGLDISEFAITNAPEAVRPYVRVGSVAEPFGRRYDLIVCIEVLEHISCEEAERAVVNFCAHTDDVLFSSSPLDFKEATHFNVHPVEYWADLFARQGFVRDVDFDASFLTPWAIRFRRSTEPQHRVVRNYERRFWELWKANTDLRELALEQRKQLEAAAAVIQSLHATQAELQFQLAAQQLQLAAHQQTLQMQQQTIQIYHDELHRHTLTAKQREKELTTHIEQELKVYVGRLEADLTRKIVHINALKGAVENLEAGRLMRVLRFVERWRSGRTKP